VSFPGFEPREGGVKIVFDVPEAVAEDVARTVADAGFDVQRYYDDEHEHRLGGSAPGFLRLGAERPMREFTQCEEVAIVAGFDAIQDEAGFECSRMGVDVWKAGDDGGTSGVREPRRPAPIAEAGNAEPLGRPR
jgi:hypothetical protein